MTKTSLLNWLDPSRNLRAHPKPSYPAAPGAQPAPQAQSTLGSPSLPPGHRTGRGGLRFQDRGPSGDLYEPDDPEPDDPEPDDPEPDDPEPDDQPIMAVTKPATISTTKSVIGMCATVQPPSGLGMTTST